MPDFEVTLVAQRTVVVLNAANPEEAYDFAVDEADFRAGSIYESKVRPITDSQDLDASARHADFVSKG